MSAHIVAFLLTALLTSSAWGQSEHHTNPCGECSQVGSVSFWNWVSTEPGINFASELPVVTAYTIVTIVNTDLDTTTTKVMRNKDAPEFSVANTNSDGFRTATVEYTFDGSTRTTTLYV